MSLELWLTFVAASAVLLIIPGPTILLVVSYALSRGRAVALATAAGVALGDLTAMTVSVAGLGAVLLASATAFTVVKWVGALYLVWLGIGMLRKAADTGATLPVATGARDARGMLWHAAAVTALNPKSIGFFVAFVPQFIRPEAALAPQLAVLIATFVAMAGLNSLAYALLADHFRSRITRPSVLGGLTRAGGATLIAMGVATAAARRAL